MRSFLLTLFTLAFSWSAFARESDIIQAELNPADVTTIVLNGTKNENARLQKLAPKLVKLESAVIAGFSDDTKASDAVSAIAACNTVRAIEFRDCALEKLPSNLRMLTQVRTFTSQTTTIRDGEQFYNAIADMPNVENVNVTGNDFRTLPNSFFRMRVMNKVVMVNLDLQLATGYDLNNKTADELVVTDSVMFGFGADILLLSYTCYNQEACTAHLQMFRDVLQGAYRQSNVFYTPLQGKIYRKQHPLVKPPVKGVDVYPDLYTYNAMTGTTLKYGSGTKINIPPMAFEDANGSVVTGNVDITYREFRDPVDVILSGIPMKYDSGGTVADFQSAGMFEINASQNGNEVYVKDGVEIGIDFAVTDTASTYNFYRLDEQKGWQYLESTGAVEQEMVPVDSSSQDPWSDAMTYYANNISKARGVRPVGDTTSFENRYADTSYIAGEKVKIKSNMYWKDKRKRSSKLYLRKYYSGTDYTLVKVGRVKGYRGNPELDVYGGHYWKINGKWKSQDLGREYGRKTGICDMRVINEGGTYYLEMKYYWGFKRIEAEPVQIDGHHKPVELSDDKKDRLYARYTKQLNRRAQGVNKENQRQIKQWRKSKAKAGGDSLDVYNNTRKYMDSTEAAMDYASWLTYTKAERERFMTEEQRAWQATGNVSQALRISGMGVFNCDQIARLVQPVSTAISKVKTAVGAAIVPVIVYVVDRARNLVLTYTGNAGGGVPITYGGKATNQLLAVDGTGSLYMTSADEFNSRKQSEIGDEVNGTLISGPQSTPESIRQAIFGPDPAQQ